MKCERIGGSTGDLAEIIVDYTKTGRDKAQIKGVSGNTKEEIFKSAFYDWFMNSIGGCLILIGSIAGFGIFLELEGGLVFTAILITIAIFLGNVSILSCLHLNPKFNQKWKTIFALKTGDEPRSYATFTRFKTKVFVIRDFDNVVLEYSATKDVARQLKKIWIKEELKSSIYSNQAIIKNPYLRDDDNVWNAYFFFKRLPKDGELYLEWR